MSNKDIIESSGNVFADLGMDNPEEILAKSEMTRHIRDIIEKRNLTQKEAAEILGIDQPRVSDLVRGYVTRFSSDRLFHFLKALGQDVEIRIKPRVRSTKPGKLKVVKQQKRRTRTKK